jgi:hypothetical protein
MTITFEEIKNLLPSTTLLRCVDYRDNLEHHPRTVNQCVKDNNFDVLNDMCDSWYEEDDSYYIEELSKDLMRKYDITKDEADDIIEENIYVIRDTLRDRDMSNVTKDLLRNKGEFVWYYETGIMVDYPTQLSEEELTEKIDEIISLGMIDTQNLRNQLEFMLLQCYYGGEIVIYFTEDFDNLINLHNEFKTISFNSYHLCCNDRWNGSGDHCFIKQPLTLPFNRDKVKLCKLDEHSYTYDVCGMSSTWCEDTEVSLV